MKLLKDLEAKFPFIDKIDKLNLINNLPKNQRELYLTLSGSRLSEQLSEK